MLTAIRNLIRTLILPNNAGPNDGAIILGPDLPACMQFAYSSAIFFRPSNTQTGINDNDAPTFFMAQRKEILMPFATATVDEGWLLNDPLTGRCSYIVVRSRLGQNGGNNSIGFQDIFGAFQTPIGGATQLGQYAVQIGGAPNRPVLFQVRGTGSVPSQAEFTIDAVSVARGLRAEVSSTANTAAIGAETVVLTGPSMTFYNGRAYLVTFEMIGQASVANYGDFQVKRNSIAGALKALVRVEFSAVGGTFVNGRAFLANTSGADITDNIVLTMTASAGTITGVGGSTTVRTLQTWDCGAAASFPNAIQI